MLMAPDRTEEREDTGNPPYLLSLQITKQRTVIANIDMLMAPDREEECEDTRNPPKALALRNANHSCRKTYWVGRAGRGDIGAPVGRSQEAAPPLEKRRQQANR